MIGRTIGNRYKILEKIGGGGMALVYKARCTLLDRIVAIKILQPQFANDDDFVKRFRREAQAAASLSHPNIVNIYDVGKEGDTDYIVLEYVDGKTLKEYIEEKGPLSTEETVRIGIQICDALEHAHKNKIIHRDIKPHNILITKDGRVKVTDFGIARAVSASTLTQTGSVLGSVHYFSPEQARGGIIGERSDLYSLGVVLYEMVTANVPFKGESPIAVALKHLNEQVIPPSQKNLNVPKGLESIIMKALSKDQNVRYQKASEMRQDLQKVLREPDSPIAQYKEIYDCDTKLLPAVEGNEEKHGGMKGSNAMTSKDRKINKKAKRSITSFLIWMILLGFLVGAMTWGVYWVKDFFTVPLVEVPDVIGLSEEDAQRKFERAGLQYEVADRVFDQSPPGQVIDQSPKGGEKVKINRPPINIWVSKGPKQVPVPNLIGKDEREARILLTTYELKPGEIKQEYSDDYPEGIVMEQNPRAEILVKEGTEVNFVVSKGPEPKMIKTLDFRGNQLELVKEKLKELGLNLGEIKYKESLKYPEGIILEQDPAPNTEILQGQTINFVVSKGPGQEEKRQVTFNVVLPSKPERLDVKVIISDSLGRRVAYESVHKPEDSPISVTVEGVGQIKVDVLVNGVLWGEDFY
jgi:serine/threonine-protein kinase